MLLRSKVLWSTVCLAALSACGSGGSGSSAIPSPITTAAQLPAPTPTPTPTPTPVNFNTAEYRRSTGLDNINALAAYDEGGTGEGVIIAIVDSGIDRGGAEFAGRIHPDSTNTANPGTTFDDQDGHGSFVASVAAGDNNAVGSHGVAFDAQILALRTDDGNSCASADGCSHFDVDIAAAIDIADQAGAKVSNVSLGGGSAAFSLRSAINRATQNGMIVVISGGNEGQSQPDSFALVGQTAGANGRVLIAGYVDDNNVIAENSNRAGNAADIFVVAPGIDILATGLNEERFLVSGSSFAAPHVSGAIAVLYDLFPTLTADEMIDLITSTATDLGAPGVDNVYGHGLINLEEAVRPQGTLQAAITPVTGGASVLTPFNGAPQTSSAFGDAVAAGLTGQRATGLDRFNRAYEVDLAPFAQSQRRQVGLSAILDSQQSFAHSAIGTQGGTLFAQVSLQQQTPLNPALLKSFSGAFADRADDRQMTGRVTAQFDGLTVKSSFGMRPDPVLQPTGERMLISLRETDGATYGLGEAPGDSGVAARYTITRDISVTAQTNWAQQVYRTAFNERQESQLWQSAVSLSYRMSDNASAALSLGLVRERGQLFGSAANNGALSLGSGARTLYAQASYQSWLSAKTYVAANAAYGSTAVDSEDQASLLQTSGALGVSSWGASLRSVDAFAGGDTVMFSISQPQRVESGTAALTGLQTAAISSFSLAPTGRQIDSEIAYQLPIKGWGTLSANALMRRDLGHVAGQSDVAGFIRFSSGF